MEKFYRHRILTWLNRGRSMQVPRAGWTLWGPSSTVDWQGLVQRMDLPTQSAKSSKDSTVMCANPASPRSGTLPSTL